MKNNLLILLLLGYLNAFTQAKYTVFKTVGNIQYFSSKTKQWEPLHPKDSINSNTKIKCVSNSALIIFDSKYQIFEVKQTGEFLVKNSIQSGSQNNNKEMQKAVKFFVEQTFSANSNSNTQKAKGAVYRGEETVFPWDSAIITEDTFTLSINLSRTQYPAKLSIGASSFIIYQDTQLILPSTLLLNDAYTTIRLGSERVLHWYRLGSAKTEALDNLTKLCQSKAPLSAAILAISIEYCLENRYYSMAYSLFMKAHDNDQTLKELKELLKENENALVLLKL